MRSSSCFFSFCSFFFIASCAAPEPSSSPSPPPPPPPSSSSSCAAAVTSLPPTLSQTGLFDDGGVLCDGVRSFVPAATLWSDGAEKQRFLRLPAGGVIDASDVDHWSFPRGTRLWKEFVVDGVRTETRAMIKVGEGDAADGWQIASYAWRADASDADLVVDGVVDAHGSGWDIPAAVDCQQCHVDVAGRFHVLGFSAVQLSADDQLQRLVDESLLAPAPPTTQAPAHAWPSTQKKALLYLNANCGHCHQPGGQGYEGTLDDEGHGLDLHVSFVDVDAAASGAATTTLAPLLSPIDQLDRRVVPGDAEHSGLYARISHRGEIQMPPLGTDVVDDAGAALVAAWINAL